MLRPLFRKYFVLIFLVFIAVLGICAFSTHYLMRFQMNLFFKSQANNLIHQIENHVGDKVAYVEELNAMNRKMHSPVRLELKAKGEKIKPSFGPTVVQPILIDNQEMTFVLALEPLPEKPLRSIAPLRSGGTTEPALTPVTTDPLDPLRPALPRGLFGGRRSMGPPIIPFLALIFAVLLASALSVMLIFRSFRDKAELAKDVLSKMQNGDLKARFPISKLDEASQIFILYNSMADEIERLVDQLRQNEQMRISLLQQLAHDLRTPVSSLRNVIETLRYDEKLLNEQTKEDIKVVALHETEYLSRLVEDLLFLALVLEPKYKNESEEVSIRDLLASQLTVASSAHPTIKYQLIDNLKGNRALAIGSPHSLIRMFRNALENAYSFARSEVTITLSELTGKIKISIRDDGPGLSENTLATFGKKKASRYQGVNANGRISVGLGSVIIQTIATAHAGEVAIANVTDARGEILGAELTITIGSAMKIAA
jgi:signal transduction histidine kinase